MKIFFLALIFPFVLFAQDPEDDIVFDALDIVIDESMTQMVETVMQAPEEEVGDEVSVAVLDYLTEVYASVGFYESGYKGPALEERIIPYYRGPVKKSDPSEFIRPVFGKITSGFGWRPGFNRMHKGIDIALTNGEKVRCVLPGVVTIVNFDGKGYGNYIIVAHSDGLETRYGHLSRTLVRPGQLIEAGETIGLGGETGNATGPHLHFESRRFGVPLDPLAIFDF